MSQSKHTPGPWKVCDCGNCDQTQVITLNGKIEAQNPMQARLIATAPELLEIAKAYRNLLKTMAHTDGEIRTYTHILDTIAKAEGKE